MGLEQEKIWLGPSLLAVEDCSIRRWCCIRPQIAPKARRVESDSLAFFFAIVLNVVLLTIMSFFSFRVA